MSHSTALIDVTHPFTQRKRGKKHIKHPKRKMRTTDQTEVLCCVSVPADVVFPAEGREVQHPLRLCQQPIIRQHPGLRRVGDRSYPLICCPPPSSPLSPPAFCRCRGDAAFCPQPSCADLSSHRGAVCTRSFPTDPLGNQEAVTVKLGKTGGGRKRVGRVNDGKGKEDIDPV